MTKYFIVLKRIRAYNNVQMHIECLPNYSVYVQQAIYMKGTVDYLDPWQKTSEYGERRYF